MFARFHTTDHAGKRRRLTLFIIGENKKWVRGWKVDKDGDRSDEMHLIDKTTITKRIPLVMNNFYGILEEEEDLDN